MNSHCMARSPLGEGRDTPGTTGPPTQPLPPLLLKVKITEKKKLGNSIYLFIGPLCFPDSHSLGLNDGCVINDSLMTQGRQHPSPIIAANEKIQIEVSSSISFLISFPSSVISLSAELSRQYDEQRFGETEPWPTYGNSIVVMMTIFKRS